MQEFAQQQPEDDQEQSQTHIVTSESHALTVSSTSGEMKALPALSSEQQAEVAKRLSEANLATMTPDAILKIGDPEVQGLNTALKGFLAGVSPENASVLLKILQDINRGIEGHELERIAEMVTKKSTPSAFMALIGKFIPQFAPDVDALTRDQIDAVGKEVSEATRSLEKFLGEHEAVVEGEIVNIMGKLGQIESLKYTYRGHFENLLVVVAVLQALCEQLESDIEAKKQECATSPTLRLNTELEDMEQKLSHLRNRFVTVKTMLLRLPAYHVLIQQIEAADVSNLQELINTARTRFTGVRMACLGLSHLVQTHLSQQVLAATKNLDATIQQTVQTNMNQVVLESVTAPGDTRLEEAKSLQKLVGEMADLRKTVNEARRVELGKYRQAEAFLEQAHQELIELEQHPTSNTEEKS